jgi:N-acyl-D-aspartate/D-glutamate deacylase
MHDVIIAGGTIVDGTGQPSFTGDVPVTNGHISGVGRDLGPARCTLKADGLLVTPGWVDVHTHYDGQAVWDPLLTRPCGTAYPRSSWATAESGLLPCAPTGVSTSSL